MNDQTNHPAHRRIILPLDGIGSAKEIDRVLVDLNQHIGFAKVGLELMMAMGAPQATAHVHETYGLPIMADGKIGDIEKTMGGAVRRLVQHPGVAMLTVHASAPKKGLAAAVKNRGNALIIGVTVLTDFDEPDCVSVFGDTPGAKVVQFALRLVEVGAQAIVCSPLEVAHLSKDPRFDTLKKITPGVRPLWAVAAGQTRYTTPFQAIMSGAELLVVGDPLLNPPHGLSRQRAAQLVAKEIAQAQLLLQNPRALRRFDEDELRAILASRKCLFENDHIVGASGRHLDTYLKWRPVFEDEIAGPAVCEEVAARMTDWNPDVIVGPETGGASMARFTAEHLSRHFDRAVLAVTADKAGVDGQGRQLFKIRDEALERLRGKRLAFTEDTMTSGWSLHQAVTQALAVDGTSAVGAVVLANRGGVTAETLGVPELRSVLVIPLNSWAEEECPMCIAGAPPVNPLIGHGKDFLARQAAASGEQEIGAS